MEVRGIGHISNNNAPRIIAAKGYNGIGDFNWTAFKKKALQTFSDDPFDKNKIIRFADQEILPEFQKASDKILDNPVSHFIAATSLWPARSAFIGLVKVNFRGWASRIKRMDDLSKLKKQWEQLGGAWGDLNAAVNHGWDKNYVFGIKRGEGARDETDQDLINSVSQNFRVLSGKELSETVFDTASPTVPGLTPTGTYVTPQAQPTGTYVTPKPGYVVSPQVPNIQVADFSKGYAIMGHGIGEAEAALIPAAAAIIAAIVPLIANSQADKQEASIQDDLANGKEVTISEYEKLWRLKAIKEQADAHNKAKLDGKTEAEAIQIALNAYNEAMRRQREQYTAEQKAKEDAAKDESSSDVSLNFGKLIQDNLPLVGVAIAAAIFLPKLLK